MLDRDLHNARLKRYGAWPRQRTCMGELSEESDVNPTMSEK